MMKTIYKVEGIHCASCEILIEETLSDIKGVKKVEVDLVKKEVAIESDFEIDLKKLMMCWVIKQVMKLYVNLLKLFRPIWNTWDLYLDGVVKNLS